MTSKANRLFHDEHGNQAIIQAPNLPVIAWFVCAVAAYFLSEGVFRSGIISLGRAFLFTWAYLEITGGLSYFRRILGVVVMVGILISFF